jgi:chromosomal replication initiation ATPase DnaA
VSSFTEDFLNSVRVRSAVLVVDVEIVGRDAAVQALRQARAIIEGRLEDLGALRIVPDARRAAIDIIDALVAGAFGVDIGVMLSRSRSTEATLPRQVAIYIARDTTHYSASQLARHYGFKDHTTVCYARREMPNKIHAGRVPFDVAALTQQVKIALVGASDQRNVAAPSRLLRAVS